MKQKNNQPLSTQRHSLHSRRDFLSVGLEGLATLGLMGLPLNLWAQTNHQTSKMINAAAMMDPHFFLQIVIPGGMDPTYHFDGRPLSMTAAKKVQNYLGQEPTTWTGRNGVTCLASALTQSLIPYRDYFSILNGVLMATSFDGHDQNLNFLLTGDPFGGECFIPHLNQKGSAPNKPIDAVEAGSLVQANLSNFGSVVPITPEGAGRLTAAIQNATPINFSTPLMAHIRDRMKALSQGSGNFSKGTQTMLGAMEQSPNLANLLKNVQVFPDPKDTNEIAFVKMAGEYFRRGISRSAIITLPANLDAHDVTTAKDQGKNIGDTFSKIANIIKTLKDTPFDSTRSLFDVTTFCIASEFGRTMRQLDKSFSETGTDHNPLTNTLLVGGKGIRSGLVIGASDFENENCQVSEAHRKLDEKQIKIMGKPFDFEQMVARKDLPAAFDPEDYLTVTSVANSFYSQFGVPKSLYRKVARNGPDAKVLSGLLV